MMSNPHGHFVWLELMTIDADAASAFYGAVVGWRAQDAGLPDRRYLILHAGDTPMGGIMDLPAAARAGGARPGWMGYVGVDDVDSYAARVQAAGGKIHRAPDDIPGVGRFAVAADPQGAAFTLFTPLAGGDEPPAAGPTPGRVGWHELQAAAWEPAFAFYAGLFGWTRTEAIDMGAMGTYQTFATGGPTGEHMTGGMMTKGEAVPAPVWLYYVNVTDTAAAVARAEQAGGKLLHGPTQVPGGSWVAHCLDPQGAVFALVGPTATG